MSENQRERTMSERVFWIRLGLTMGLLAVPLAWLIVVFDVSMVTIGVVSIAFAVGLLAIWDGSRLLPDGLVFWGRGNTLRDENTGLFNPRGWKDLLEAEEDRARRHGLVASVVVVRVSGAADETPALRAPRVGKAIKTISRAHDIAAYLDEDTFGVLAVAAGQEGSEALVRRLRGALTAEGFEVRWAAVERTDTRDLMTAWQEATARLEGRLGENVTSA